MDFDSVADVLVEAGERWLWCVQRQRFFQAQSLKNKWLEERPPRALDERDAANYDIDIDYWQRGLHEPQWPLSVEELCRGLRTAP